MQYRDARRATSEAKAYQMLAAREHRINHIIYKVHVSRMKSFTIEYGSNFLPWYFLELTDGLTEYGFHMLSSFFFAFGYFFEFRSLYPRDSQCNQIVETDISNIAINTRIFITARLCA